MWKVDKEVPESYEARYGVSAQVSDLEKIIQNVSEGSKYTDRILTSCRISEKNLLSWGVEPEKIVRIPLGVDTTHFKPPTLSERQHLREQFGIPEDAICIGSFQKDSSGWDENFTIPKIVKGPDVFLKVIEQLAKKLNIFVLLTGPARGFIKTGLKQLGVPFRHDRLENYLDVARYYQAIDLYLITSRCEGGPKALLEAMATGVPVVSTRVGMSADLIEDEKNGIIVDVDDVDGLVNGVFKILNDSSLRDQIINNAYELVQGYDWKYITDQYGRLLYGPLFRNSQ
jgi:glycosyltransferase involved in cell wall biosynthesis